MTKLNRWLDELPEHSPDRILLGAGRSARPPEGSKEAAWRAIRLSLGAAATSATLSAQASSALSANSPPAGAVVAAQGSAIKGMVGAASWSLGVKAITLGFVVGMGLVGAGEVIHRVNQQAPAASDSLTTPTPRAANQPRLPQTITTQEQASAELLSAASSATEPVTRSRELGPLRAVVSQPRLQESSEIEQGKSVSSAPVAPRQDVTTLPNQQHPLAKASSLTEQARELASIQRMLDAGASAEAIRQLEASMGSDPGSGLAEERDALYVQALVKAQRTTQATTWARRFIQRYPSSPHLEKMRRVVSAE